MTRFGCKLVFASPDILKMPAEIVSDLKAHGGDITETEDLYSMMEDADVVYMTRIKKNAFLMRMNMLRWLVLTSYMLMICQM